MRFTALLIVFIAPLTWGDDRASLLDGVKQIAVAGSPGTVVAFGRSAFVLIADDGKAAAPVVAAAPMGRGRLVAFGHEGYFHADALDTADTAKLLVNCAVWA